MPSHSPHEISFQDAKFPHRNAWYWSNLEGHHKQWIPFGMPRLSPYLEQVVFFLYGRDPSGKSEGWRGPLGSGVIVGCHSERVPVVWSYYAVTARHVIRNGAHAIRVNTRDGGSRIIDIGIDQWSSMPEEDVAVVDITDRFQEDDAVSHVSFKHFVTDGFMASVRLGAGEDGFMLGLFLPNPGDKNNQVAARFGNVSQLAEQEAPIERKDDGTGDKYNSPCHVFDIHSRPGYSGSPVFVYRTPDGDLRDIDNRGLGWRGVVREIENIHRTDHRIEFIDESSGDNKFLRLLGIHANQFHDSIRVKKIKAKQSKSEDADTIRDGEQIRFPGSMTIVVPAWAIMRLIEMDDSLGRQREARWNAAKKAADESESCVAFESSEETQPKSDVSNPDHKGDFTRLLNAAAKAKPQGD